jgi:hypothetical protein
MGREPRWGFCPDIDGGAPDKRGEGLGASLAGLRMVMMGRAVALSAVQIEVALYPPRDALRSTSSARSVRRQRLGLIPVNDSGYIAACSVKSQQELMAPPARPLSSPDSMAGQPVAPQPRLRSAIEEPQGTWPAFTRSRRSLPALKKGTDFASTESRACCVSAIAKTRPRASSSARDGYTAAVSAWPPTPQTAVRLGAPAPVGRCGASRIYGAACAQATSLMC